MARTSQSNEEEEEDEGSIGDVIRVNVDQGTKRDQTEVDGHGNAGGRFKLFMSEDELADPQPTPKTSHISKRRKMLHQVVVPPVRDREAYHTYLDELRVRRVLEELGRATSVKPPRYVVGFEDGSEDIVRRDRLLSLPRGRTALDTFKQVNGSRYNVKSNSVSHSRPSRRESSRRNSDMRSTRVRSRASSPPGFVSSTNLRFSSSEDDDDIDTVPTHGGRQPARSARVSVPHSHSLEEEYGSGEDSDADSESDYDLRRRDHDFSDESMDERTTKGARKRQTRIQQPAPQRLRLTRRSSIDTEMEDLVLAQGTRRSGRAGRSTKSMKERTVDDIYASGEEGEDDATIPKYIGVREIFRQLSKTDDFRHTHCQFCDSCRQFGDNATKGPLVFCQGCSLSYHRACLGPRNQRDHLVTKVAEEDFVLQCRRCINMARKKDPLAPRHDVCSQCRQEGPACSPFRIRKTASQEQKEREDNDGEDPITDVDPQLISNPENVLYRCLQCIRAFHFHHLSPLDGSDDENDEDTEAYVHARKREYCRAWLCKECQLMPSKVSTLVAWRPINLDTYVPGTSTDMVCEDDKEYLVKWDKLSYFRTTWAPGSWTYGVTSSMMRKAFAKQNNTNNLPVLDATDAIPEEYFRTDIVFDVKYSNIVDIQTESIDKARIKEVVEALVKFKGLGYEDAVWEQVPTPDDGERWTDFSTAYDNWVMGKYISAPKKGALRERIARVKSTDFERKLLQAKQPDSLVGGDLMAYQLEGLNWLIYKWYQGQNSILADEMGLGKTVQIIGLLAALIQGHRCFPFLIVVPNSTCPNWRREIQKWAPSIRAVTYYGTSKARQMAYEYELFPKGYRDLKCHVVITSYETAIDDTARRFFKSVSWAGLVVDEGQRLKNDKNQLYEALSVLDTSSKVLLTGTPLQNNARELFNLLQFLDPSISASKLEVEYAELTKENVPQLHDLIRPFFLRRTKAQVLTFLPPMAQVIVPVTMSVVQKKLYRSILAKNPELIKAIFGRTADAVKQSERRNLNNILMQLRKCLCHPFVYSRAIEERSSSAAVSHRNLVEASSKLQLLEIMLPKLHERGHRVLIFSQFLDMLNVMEDFLDGLQLRYERLDGTVSSLVKQKRIDAFNAPGSELFAFLLSTRAGGVGINLATADTVIIMDPDFNPHQDIQALSRAHRIGQKKKVLVFQLMTRDSAEEKIIQIGRNKRALDHVLIEQMDAEEDAGQSLESILRHGAAALFEDDTQSDILYDSASVDKLLDRSQAESTKTGDDSSAESQFSFARVWANDKATLEEELKDTDTESRAPDPTVWDKILKERERDAAREAAKRQEALGRGKRKRQTVDYNQAVEGMDLSPVAKRRGHNDSSSDTDFRDKGAESEDDPDVAAALSESERLEAQRKKQRVGSTQPPTPAPAPPPAAEVRKRGRKPRKPTGAPEMTLANGPPPTTPGAAVQMLTPYAWIQYPPPPGHSASNIPQLDGNGHDVPIAVAPAHSQYLGPAPQPHLQAPAPMDAKWHPCWACNQVHPVGFCPLKTQGVERCGLCGLVHFGAARSGVLRACPHLSSETQVRAMIDALNQSTEPKWYVDQARVYLRGVKGSLVQKKKKQRERIAQIAGTTPATAGDDGGAGVGSGGVDGGSGGAAGDGGADAEDGNTAEALSKSTGTQSAYFPPAASA